MCYSNGPKTPPPKKKKKNMVIGRISVAMVGTPCHLAGLDYGPVGERLGGLSCGCGCVGCGCVCVCLSFLRLRFAVVAVVPLACSLLRPGTCLAPML